jgi:hypothetical protein
VPSGETVIHGLADTVVCDELTDVSRDVPLVLANAGQVAPVADRVDHRLGDARLAGQADVARPLEIAVLARRHHEDGQLPLPAFEGGLQPDMSAGLHHLLSQPRAMHQHREGSAEVAERLQDGVDLPLTLLLDVGALGYQLDARHEFSR